MNVRDHGPTKASAYGFQDHSSNGLALRLIVQCETEVTLTNAESAHKLAFYGESGISRSRCDVPDMREIKGFPAFHGLPGPFFSA